MLDFIIVGSGLAGLAVTQNLRKRGCKVKVFDNDSFKASRVAGGLYNPVVLKRFTLTWEGPELMNLALKFYEELEQDWNIECDIKQPVYRRFASVSEQNSWFEASDRTHLSNYLVPEIVQNENPSLNAAFGYGKVKNTGRIATRVLLDAYHRNLRENKLLESVSFCHNKLVFRDGEIQYEDYKTHNVIFCEGFGMHANPFFNYLPLQGTKGELITIYAPELREDRIIKSGVFFIPLGNDRYRVGATYAWDDFSQEPTEKARVHLLSQLRQFVSCKFEVESQVAGIRPTVPDRRPLAGKHPDKTGLYVLNGLGSRGVLLAPYVAKCLVENIFKGQQLPPEIDIVRYVKYFAKPETT